MLTNPSIGAGDLARVLERFAQHCLLVATMVLVFAPVLHAQERSVVVGSVTSAEDGSPIVGMMIEIAALRIRGVSDSTGAFRLASVPPGAHQINLRRIGFAEQRRVIGVAEGELLDLGTLAVTPVAERLEDVVVEAEAEIRSARLDAAGFYERAKMGSGSYAEREDIEKWTPQRFTDVLRHMRGFIIERNRNYGKPLPPKLSEFGYALEPSIGIDTRRFIIRTRRSGRAQCPPLVFMDGIRLGSTLDFNINQLDPDVLQGIEAYSGPAQVPAEYNRHGADCGVILVWTR